ncbi:hypothetical protein [Streptomyces beijiangensis]|uniref:hypothetical protein n=1 Tax=Streptomyces beijiangensis TaxID=163361 RepID=UPI0027DD6C76|nr:hypothetical protein [Streptomyces beijiangensis]
MRSVRTADAPKPGVPPSGVPGAVAGAAHPTKDLRVRAAPEAMAAGAAVAAAVAAVGAEAAPTVLAAAVAVRPRSG